MQDMQKPGYVHCKESLSRLNLTKAALAAFRAVSKSISVDNIVSCRRSAAKEQQGNSVRTSNIRPPHLFVWLRSSATANNMINAKRKYSLLHARDLDQSLLDPADRPNVINTNIFSNEVLEKNKYKHFQNLKITAKKLGFKYVWHRRGSFLIKWRDRERSHVFNTAADLSAIAIT